MLQWRKRVTEIATVVGLVPMREIYYLIFSFPRSGNKAKYGVNKLRHSIHNSSKIRRNVWNGVS